MKQRDTIAVRKMVAGYLKSNGHRISSQVSTTTKDYIVNCQDLQGIDMTNKLALPTLITLCSVSLGRPVLGSMAVLGEISISGILQKVDNGLANVLQAGLDNGARKVLPPISSGGTWAWAAYRWS